MRVADPARNEKSGRRGNPHGRVDQPLPLHGRQAVNLIAHRGEPAWWLDPLDVVQDSQVGTVIVVVGNPVEVTRVPSQSREGGRLGFSVASPGRCSRGRREPPRGGSPSSVGRQTAYRRSSDFGKGHLDVGDNNPQLGIEAHRIEDHSHDQARFNWHRDNRRLGDSTRCNIDVIERRSDFPSGGGVVPKMDLCQASTRMPRLLRCDRLTYALILPALPRLAPRRET